MTNVRGRWAAIGAAVAVSLGAGSIGLVNAAKGSGERAVYTAINPCRLADTRAEFAVGARTTPLGAGDVHAITVASDSGECSGIPTDVVAVGLNVTAVGATQPTFLTIWPGGTRPNASSLNPMPGQPPAPNAVSVDLADDGTFQVFNLQGTVHLVVDLVGIYQHHDHDDRYYPRAEVDELVVGLEGEPGPQGDRGLSAWDTIPTGVTVTGSWEQRFPATGPNENYSISVPLPARAPRPLANESVNFASPTGPTTLLADGDPDCTGTVDAPTAPPGKVCLYRSGSGQVGQMYGSNLLHLGETGFRIVWSSRANTELNNQMYMTLTWAYTAPKTLIR